MKQPASQLRMVVQTKIKFLLPIDSSTHPKRMTGRFIDHNGGSEVREDTQYVED